MLNYLLSFLSINTVGAGHPYSKQQQLMLNVAVVNISQSSCTAFNIQCVSDFGSGVAIIFGLFLSNQQVSSTVLMWRD